MKIFLDDQAKTDRASWVPTGYVVAVNPAEFKQLIETAITNNEVIEAISFDNDLGEEIEGRHLFKWLMETYSEIMKDNPEITVHSANPTAKEWMDKNIDFWRQNYEELIAVKNRPHPFENMKK